MDIENSSGVGGGVTGETPREATSLRRNTFKKVNMKMAVAVAAVVIVAALLYVHKGVFVAATVDGNPISRMAVMSHLEKTYGKATLDSLIIETLIENEAKKRGITVTNEEVDAEFAKIEGQISAQGAKIDELLEAQSMTRDDLKGQIVLQKKMDKMVADSVAVSDADVDEYIKTMQVTVPQGEEGIAMKAQITEQLKAQKSAEESQKFIDTLRAGAKIKRFVWY